MPRLRTVLAGCLCAALAAAGHSQRAQRATLSEAQIEQIRDAGIDPNLRIALYTRFLQERADAMKKLAARASSRARNSKLDGDLQDFTSLMDETSSNLDQYGDRQADMRPALKKLNEAAPKWMELLQGLPQDPRFDESRKEAIESCQDLAQDARDLETRQLAYFKVHKKQKGQERAEPQ